MSHADPESAPLASPAALHRLRQMMDVVQQSVSAVDGDIEKAQCEILGRLLSAAEVFEGGACHHGRNTGRVSALVLKALGLPPAQCKMLELASALHDIGKVGVPQAIVTKIGKLEPAEYEAMKQHTTIGGRLLAGSPFPVVQMACDVALGHHERWDGSGYPAGLHGDEIPLVGQVVAIADVWDALTHERTYKKAWHHAVAIEEIQRQSGRSFGPRIVEAFVGCYSQGLLAETYLHQLGTSLVTKD